MQNRVSAMLGVTVFLAAVGWAQTQPEKAPATQPASKVFAFDQMSTRKSANGTESRAIPNLTLTTGEVVGMHESVQPAGAPPVPLHAIQHSELVLVREGSMVFEHDGIEEKAGPGDVVYVAFGTTHRVINVGSGPARYFVVQIGGDTKK
jgi:mannose-6-phosphate isomerase-like protein (cupin superfamily)